MCQRNDLNKKSLHLKKHLQGQGQVKACTAYEQLPLFAEERNSLGLRAGNSFFHQKQN